MLAISTDPSAESAKFARDYAIGFPLLSDADGAVSRAYVGVNYDDTTIPGIVVIRRDGAIVFRQVAAAKDDRLSAAALFATVDRSLGTHGAAARSGYATYDRWQLHVDAGGGARTAGAIATASASVLYPLGRQLLIGPWVASDLHSSLDVDLAVAVRAPLLHETGAVQLTLTTGLSPWGTAEWNAGARVGPWFAVSPSWAVHLDIGVTTRGLDEREVIATFGISRLIRGDDGL